MHCHILANIQSNTYNEIHKRLSVAKAKTRMNKITKMAKFSLAIRRTAKVVFFGHDDTVNVVHYTLFIRRWQFNTINNKMKTVNSALRFRLFPSQWKITWSTGICARSQHKHPLLKQIFWWARIVVLLIMYAKCLT